jgi:choline dehydrogenase-like flavoprotein
VSLFAAVKTGHVKIRPQARVFRLEQDPVTRLITHIHFVDARTGGRAVARARRVLLCASTLESTRILLLSANDRDPLGLGNRSGLLGRNLMDHVATAISGTIPGYGDISDARAGGYRWLVLPGFRACIEPSSDFLRGYAIYCRAQRTSHFGHVGSQTEASFLISAVGEMLANPDNRATVHPTQSDRWGIPVLQIQCDWGDNERKMMADATRVMNEMIAEAGFRPLQSPFTLTRAGQFIHEVGTARMGVDPATSYLNPELRAWEVPNLWVSDGAAWPTSAYQNPTLTMMALSDRAAESILGDLGG